MQEGQAPVRVCADARFGGALALEAHPRSVQARSSRFCQDATAVQQNSAVCMLSHMQVLTLDKKARCTFNYKVRVMDNRAMECSFCLRCSEMCLFQYYIALSSP